MLPADLPSNAGVMRPIQVMTREGSVVDAQYRRGCIDRVQAVLQTAVEFQRAERAAVGRRQNHDLLELPEGNLGHSQALPTL